MHVVITGASRGLGKAIAEAFAEKGHDLYLCAKNEVGLYHTMEALLTRYHGISINARPTDLSKRQEVDAFGQWLLEKGCAVDVLVNNAGSFVPGSISAEPDGGLEEMMAVNLYSAYHLTRKLLPRMLERKQGHVFNLCSIASLDAYPGGGAYSISKFALLGFSKNLREEMKDKGIKVTSIIPGAVYTDSWIDSGVSPQRIMEAADIAKMVYTAAQLSPQACVEDIIMRPLQGDL